MTPNLNLRGQSLVETAVVIPVLFFVVAVFFQLLALCHNAIALQRAASERARVIAIQERVGRSRPSLKFGTVRLIGRVIPTNFSRNTSQISPWRPFHGLKVVSNPGSLVQVEARSSLVRRVSFGRWLSAQTLRFSAEFPKEPPIPEEE